MEPFKITLRAARVNSGLSTKEVAELTGRSYDTINRYEHDSTNIPQDLMITLLNLYKVPFSYIFFGKESEKLGFKRVKSGRRKTS